MEVYPPGGFRPVRPRAEEDLEEEEEEEEDLEEELPPREM